MQYKIQHILGCICNFQNYNNIRTIITLPDKREEAWQLMMKGQGETKKEKMGEN